jgi:hypothetical protein
MTVQSRIVPSEGRDPPGSLVTRGDAFRGRFLDKCAILEQWASTILAGTGQKKKTYLFGQKIQAVRGLAQAESSPFRAPKRVVELLDRLQPFLELRTRLAHSIQVVAQARDGSDLVIFKPIHGTAPDWFRVVLEENDMERLPKELGTLAKELTDQRLKDVTRSSPLPPKPAATAGP